MLITAGKRLAGFLGDLVKHTKRLVLRRESAEEAWEALREESKHLARNLTKEEFSDERKAAIQYVKRGMTEYNQKNYTEAERLFRRAIGSDAEYVRAYAYLGNTLYQRGMTTDAVAMWNKVLQLEPDSELADNVRAKLKRAASPQSRPKIIH